MNQTNAVPSLASLHAQLASAGQEQLLAHWQVLDENQKARLTAQITGLDMCLMSKLFQQTQKQELHAAGGIEPPEVIGLPESIEDWERLEKAAASGEELLRAGKVAIVMVAGGQGSRLGHDGPKGIFPIGPVSGASLFQIHAEKVLALSRRYRQAIPFLIMTSQENDAATKAYFAEHGWFGLVPEQVTFFTQAMLPALDAATGRILLSAPDQIALSPNGHGGTLEALHRGGHLERLAAQGIEVLFYFQVDNPLVRMADPVFLGLLLTEQADLGVKVVRKTDPMERIGLVVQRGGRSCVIEYSELGHDLAHAKMDAGLRLWAGNTAIHAFQLEFLRRLARAATILPYHSAHKVVPFVDANGRMVKPEQPNAFKFEMFIFDALPLARRVVLMETPRAEEFEPLKNATGDYSPQTVKAALSQRAARWLEGAGVAIHRDDPHGHFEISPMFALDEEELRDKVAGLAEASAPLHLGPDFCPSLPAADEGDEEK